MWILLINRAKVPHTKAPGGKATGDCLFWGTHEEMRDRAGVRQEGEGENPLRTCQESLEEVSPGDVPCGAYWTTFTRRQALIFLSPVATEN